MSKEKEIIVGTFRNGVFHPHNFCDDMVDKLEGQQVALTVLTAEPEKVRSTLMNKCLHKHMAVIADNLNANNWDMIKVFTTFKPGVEIPWSMESVKERMWKPIQLAMTGKNSSTKLSNAEMIEIEGVLAKFLSSKLGISVHWPSRDNLLNESQKG